MEGNVEFMRQAIGLARAGMRRGDGGPFGAVVVRDGVVVGEGWNQVLASGDSTAHGEMVAIRDACARLGTHVLDECEIYTTGQPCPMCLGAIYWARLKKIHYGFRITDAAEIGFDDREFFQQMALPAPERRVPESELGRDEALALAREYAALPHRSY
jgi:guanine deaminase